MIIGIDVGGTHTDGVLLKRGGKSNSDRRYSIVKTAKVHTDKDNLLSSIINIIDSLTTTEENKQIRRVVLSTTLAVNTILEEKHDPVALILIPGPGVNYEAYK